jgi:hypothetical protein
MFVAGYQEVTRPQRGMDTLGEGPNRPYIATPAPVQISPDVIGAGKINVLTPAWVGQKSAQVGTQLAPYYAIGTASRGQGGASITLEYGEPLGYRYDNGNSQYVTFDTNGKYIGTYQRIKGELTPFKPIIIAIATAYLLPLLSASINESLTAAGTFESVATTKAVSDGIAQTTLQVASGTPIKKAITANVTSTLIQTQSADATNAVDRVLNNPDVSAAIVTTAGIIVKNQAAGNSTATITKAETASISSPAAVTAVTTAAATLPATTKETTMTDTTDAQNQAVLDFAKAEIAAGRTVQQIADDIKTYFNKTFTPQQVLDYLTANNLTIQAAQTATGLSSNTLLMLGGGLLLLLLLRKK